jgi:hypothetical protein
MLCMDDRPQVMEPVPMVFAAQSGDLLPPPILQAQWGLRSAYGLNRYSS